MAKDHAEEHHLHFKVVESDGAPVTSGEHFGPANVLLNERGRIFCSKKTTNINVLCEFQGEEFTLTSVICRVPLSGYSSPMLNACFFISKERISFESVAQFDSLTSEKFHKLEDEKAPGRPDLYIEFGQNQNEARFDVKSPLTGKFVLIKFLAASSGSSFTAEWVGLIGTSKLELDFPGPFVFIPPQDRVGSRDLGLSKSVYKSPKDCVAAQKCTLMFSRRSYVPQDWWECFTCPSLNGNAGVCESCVKTCHAGHSLGPVHKANSAGFYCDCGGKQDYSCRGVDMDALIAESVAQNRCTYRDTQARQWKQKWFTCSTCKFGQNEGFCESCRSICHANCAVTELGLSKSFCDCDLVTHKCLCKW